MLKNIKSFLLHNKSVRQTIAKNTLWLFVGEVISRILKMILVVYAARILGTAGWGVFAYVIGVVTIFFTFSDLGLNNLVIREFAKDSEKKLEYWSTSFIFKITLILISSILAFVIIPNISKIEGVENILLIIVLILIFDSIREFSFSINRAFQKMETEALIKIVTNLLIGVFGLYVLFNFPSVENFAYAYLIGSLVGFLVTIYLLRNYFKNIFRYFSKDLIVVVWNFIWPFLTLSILGIMMANADIVILGWWKNPEDIGLYSAAQRLIQFFYLIPNLFSFAIFPMLPKLMMKSEEKLRSALEKALSLILMFVLPLAVGGIFLAEDIVTMAYGEAYKNATFVFQIFLLGTLISFPLLIINNFIIAKDQHRKLVWYSIPGAILNISLNLLLIKKIGINGAVIATVSSGFLMTLLAWSAIKKASYFEILPHIRKIVVATIFMGAITILGKYLGINLFLNIGISVAILFLTLHFLKEPLLEELKKIFQKESPI